MKIKEVEQRTGIPSANIRFYEKEGLLNPKREKENNYREYSEEDVERLMQIKVLRLLGIAVGDIRSVYRHELSLEEVIAERTSQLEAEERHVREVRQACENILSQHLDLSMLNEQILGSEKKIWRERLQQILKEDTTKVRLGKKELNRYIAVLLIWGYGISLVMTFLLRGILLYSDKEHHEFVYAWEALDKRIANGEKPMALWAYTGNYNWMYFVVFIMVILGIVVVWSSSIKVQMVAFHISALSGTIIFILIMNVFAELDFRIRFAKFLPLYWIGAILYVAFLWFFGEMWEWMFTKVRYVLGMAVFGTMFLTAVSYLILHEWLIALVMFFLFTVYVGVFWCVTNMDMKEYNRYYAVLSANLIMNPIAIINSYRGKAASGFWR